MAEQQPEFRVAQVDQSDAGDRHGVQLHGGGGQLDQAVGHAAPGRPVPQPLVDTVEDAAARLELRRGLDPVAEQPAGQAPVQRAEPPDDPEGQDEQQQADDGAQDRGGDGQPAGQHHYGDPEPGHTGQAADAAVQQLTDGPAGERATQYGARPPPDVLVHGPYCPPLANCVQASRRASAQAPAARAATVYRHSTPKPVQGDRLCATGLTAASEFSAMIIGMNCPTEFWIEVPSGTRISGSTNSTPTTALIAPAVCLISAPRPRAMSAIRAG